jgi:hypothetical protein
MTPRIKAFFKSFPASYYLLFQASAKELLDLRPDFGAYLWNGMRIKRQKSFE